MKNGSGKGMYKEGLFPIVYSVLHVGQGRPEFSGSERNLAQPVRIGRPIFCPSGINVHVTDAAVRNL